MSLHIHRFVDAVKAAEARGQRDLQMTLRDAKDLHADITKLLITLEQMRKAPDSGAAADDIITVELTGGTFKNP
jgi:non-ribosomal peptide synthetase component F